MKSWLKKIKLPSLVSALLAVLSAGFLALAFPDFDYWAFAYVALIPLLLAVEREKDSLSKSFITGWIFGTAFFAGTCWWLTYAPIHYGGVPSIFAYILLLGAAGFAGLFPALFAGLFAKSLQRLGARAILFAPFLWIATEFLRFWLTGNVWNAVAYSQAFNPLVRNLASFGGIYFVGFLCVVINCCYFSVILLRTKNSVLFGLVPQVILIPVIWFGGNIVRSEPESSATAQVIAVQPNVPMNSIKYEEWRMLRERHVQLAERELKKLETANPKLATFVVFPESPMNFGWTQDRDFQDYLREFIAKNKVEVLFNAAEPSPNRNYFNSAVLVNEDGRKIAQYDKIHLVPFGEYVPLPEPLASMVPSMVGNFEIGSEFDIIRLGEAKAGIMICFESHFPSLSRQYALDGADVLIEMTNDGYLGPTPVLRQHLASAIFRAIETRRPVLRVTNVGISGYIDENGRVSDESQPYTEDVRSWTVKKSDGTQTFYVKYGDWFAWVCSLVSLVLLFLSFWKSKSGSVQN